MSLLSSSYQGQVPPKKMHQIDGAQLAKTRMCMFFQEGRCKYGEQCTYAHSNIEVRKAPEELRKTKMCDLFTVGECFDIDCNFAHNASELRSKKDARRKTRAPRVEVNNNINNTNYELTVELMKQLAAVLANSGQLATDAISSPSSPQRTYTPTTVIPSPTSSWEAMNSISNKFQHQVCLPGVEDDTADFCGESLEHLLPYSLYCSSPSSMFTTTDYASSGNGSIGATGVMAGGSNHFNESFYGNQSVYDPQGRNACCSPVTSDTSINDLFNSWSSSSGGKRNSIASTKDSVSMQ